MIAIERRANDGLLEGVEGVEIVDFGDAAVQREIAARPIVDPVVAEWPACRVH